MKINTAPALIAAIIFSFGAQAGEPRRTEVEAFYGMCLYPDAPFDDVSRNAPLAGYPPLPENVLQMMQPENPAQGLAGWMILPEDGLNKSIVVVSRTVIDGDDAQTCGIIFGDTNPRETVNLFEVLMEPNLIDDLNDGIQIQKSYTLVLNGQEKIISAAYSTDETDTFLKLNVIVFPDGR